MLKLWQLVPQDCAMHWTEDLSIRPITTVDGVFYWEFCYLFKCFLFQLIEIDEILDFSPKIMAQNIISFRFYSVKTRNEKQTWLSWSKFALDVTEMRFTPKSIDTSLISSSLFLSTTEWRLKLHVRLIRMKWHWSRSEWAIERDDIHRIVHTYVNENQFYKWKRLYAQVTDWLRLVNAEHSCCGWNEFFHYFIRRLTVSTVKSTDSVLACDSECKVVHWNIKLLYTHIKKIFNLDGILFFRSKSDFFY